MLDRCFGWEYIIRTDAFATKRTDDYTKSAVATAKGSVHKGQDRSQGRPEVRSDARTDRPSRSISRDLLASLCFSAALTS